jgi:L-ascorbate metabolism protein UlaG (beta-lactamase superfamily)
MKRGVGLALMLVATGSVLVAQSFVVDANAAACRSLTPAIVGGPMPTQDIATLRWLGTTNFELSYRDQVILFDTYYDRGPLNRPIGFTVAQVKRADAIFIGHAHYDHMSDAVAVATQTKAPVIGAATVTETAIAMGLSANQTVTVRGGESLKYKGFVVEPILARHSTLAPEVLAAFRSAISLATGPPTAEEQAADAAVLQRGTFDPKVITEGTMAYLLTWDSGFRLIVRDSAGPITDAERSVMRRIGGRTDVAIVAYIGQYVAKRQIEATLPIIQLYNPKLYLPAHHDELAGIFIDIGLEPLFMSIRDQLPQTQSISRLYREPICLDIKKITSR